jgi:polyvinyl alcohol dehydrogenase (cytochrome)
MPDFATLRLAGEPRMLTILRINRVQEKSTVGRYKIRSQEKLSRSGQKKGRHGMLATRQRFCWLVCAALSMPSCMAPTDDGESRSEWPMFGQNLQNTASNAGERKISTLNVATLAPKWVATTGGDVSARAAVVGGVVYFPDWGGNMWALDANTGAVIWQHQLSHYGLPAGTISRTSPAVQDDTVYIGTWAGAYLLAINAKTGDLRWKKQLDTSTGAVLTASPAVHAEVVYTGVSGFQEETAAHSDSYKCCMFRGSAVAVSARTGDILWQTYMAPPGYTGVSVWGSNPVVDARRKTMFIGTGQNFSTPTDPHYVNCIRAGGRPKFCLSPDNHVDSIVALDMKTGTIKWSRRLTDGDDWNLACGRGPKASVGKNCPKPAGADFDFGSAPNEFSVRVPEAREHHDGHRDEQRDVIGAGQKSGVYSAFDADTGDFLWGTQVGPGGSLGGILWGSATDGERIYVAVANLEHLTYAAGTEVGKAGSWSALDPTTGAILWQTPDPNKAVAALSGSPLSVDPNGAVDTGPMTVANSVVYAPSMGAAKPCAPKPCAPDLPNMFALDAATGKELWRYPSGGSVNAGAVVVDGVVYWGSGYSNLPIPWFVGNNKTGKFYAFSLGGK